LTGLLACVILCTFGSIWAAVRAPADYLHGGASKYIQGRLQEASVEVDEGLSLYPNDPKLKALAGQLKSLKDQKKQDQSSGGSQSGDDSNPKEDKKDSSSQDDSQKKDQEKKDQEKDQAKDQDKGKEKEQEDQKKGDSTGQEAAPVKPGELSKEEAERLLNSYQDDEKREHQEMQRRQKRPVGVEKDW
jgi:single-stranded DNA-binding protein